MSQQHVDNQDIQVINYIGYTPTGILGSGAFGVVVRCERRDGQSGSYAVKVMKSGQGPTHPVTDAEIDNERNIIAILTANNRRHPNVLHITARLPPIMPIRAYFISDLSPFGDLFTYFQRPNQQNIRVWVPMRENECRFIFRGVAEGLQWMNNLGVAHGDLKPQNILLFWREETQIGPQSRADTQFPAFNRMIAKLCDFGNSVRRRVQDPPGKIMHNKETCTIYFAAPEMWFRTGQIPNTFDMIAADCFSLGNTILAMLLGGYPYDHFMERPIPQFTSAQELAVFRLRAQRSCIQLKRDYSYTRRLVTNFHYYLKDVLIGLLDPNPNTRMNMATFLQHPWIRQRTVGDTPGNRFERLSTGTQPFHPITIRQRRVRSIDRVEGRDQPPPQSSPLGFLRPPPPSRSGRTQHRFGPYQPPSGPRNWVTF